MEQNLYDLMDWAGIEELAVFRSPIPRYAGPHLTEVRLLIQH